MIEIVESYHQVDDEAHLNPLFEVLVAVDDDDVNLNEEDDAENHSFDDIACHLFPIFIRRLKSYKDPPID